ncbi:MAG: response regulator [Thermoplasmatota archaeon]
MPLRIMIVDDEEDIRRSVGQVFQASGYEIITANNGNDCLNKLDDSLPDLIILDIMMPGMNGWDVAAQLKKNDKWNHIPIVFLTAKADELSIGFGGLASVDYIVKPFDILTLKEAVEKILSKM